MGADLQKLVDVSRQLGDEVGYVQGGGGNTSLKTGPHTMYIKASGRTLAGIDAEKGFIPVDWRRVAGNLSNCRTEAEYSQLLADSSLTDDKSLRPSIETGFHALLERCVLHSHSVWANILTCSSEGRDIAALLFPSALWIGYDTPGLSLTKAIAERLTFPCQSVIFLQNHGLIVNAEDEDAAFALHEELNRTIRNHFAATLAFPTINPDIPTVLREGLLFPDQAVYHSNPDLAQSRAGRETMLACEFLLHNIPRLGLTLNFIDDKEKNVLLNLETEKYRQRLITG